MTLDLNTYTQGVTASEAIMELKQLASEIDKKIKDLAPDAVVELLLENKELRDKNEELEALLEEEGKPDGETVVVSQS